MYNRTIHHNLWKVWHYNPNDIAWHPRRLKSSTMPLIWQNQSHLDWELPLLQPCCRWNSSSSSAAVMRLEVGRALMEAVRGCTGVLQPPVPSPCWWWIDSAELLLVVPADPPTIPSGSWSSLSSFSPPPSGIEDPKYGSITALTTHSLYKFWGYVTSKEAFVHDHEC